MYRRFQRTSRKKKSSKFGKSCPTGNFHCRRFLRTGSDCSIYCRQTGPESLLSLRDFFKADGCSIKKYILDFRITQSEEFLFTSDWSVDYISQICGFNSPSYFSKIFKEYHGISPTEYRKSRHKREHQTVLVK
ncbi:MAG: helix-turn-helix domain-containing protein [Dorea longicatena]